MKWIELHTSDNVTLVNTDHISDIWPNGEHCAIWLDNTDEGIQQHFIATESYDEVKQLILMDESNESFKEALYNIHNLFGNNT